jgi:hypothetical protein
MIEAGIGSGRAAARPMGRPDIEALKKVLLVWLTAAD